MKKKLKSPPRTFKNKQKKTTEIISGSYIGDKNRNRAVAFPAIRETKKRKLTVNKERS